jgi:hypothetical protein
MKRKIVKSFTVGMVVLLLGVFSITNPINATSSNVNLSSLLSEANASCEVVFPDGGTLRCPFALFHQCAIWTGDEQGYLICHSHREP